MVKLSLCLLALFGFATVTADPLFAPGPVTDLIKDLPGCDLKVSAYSGYLKSKDTKQLHYVYIGSQDKEATDPVVIWFNGGPGCSSLEGLFAEHGPCVVNEASGAKGVAKNPFSWNKRANMLYIESPAGVGFSIAKDDDDYVHTDKSQAEDLKVALDDFYTKFPTLVPNDLYIAGESYAGVYVPWIAY